MLVGLDPAGPLELAHRRPVQQRRQRHGVLHVLVLRQEPVAQHPLQARRQRRRPAQQQRLLARRAAESQRQRRQPAGLDVQALRDMGGHAVRAEQLDHRRGVERRHLEVVQVGEVDVAVGDRVACRPDRGDQPDPVRRAGAARSR